MPLNDQKLSDGNRIPPIGLGLWKVTDETDFNSMFKAAIDIGYRHFDSAQAYHNEQFLGQAWRQSGLERKDIFITTKILTQNFGYQKTIQSFNESLNKFQTDYVDLLLIHFPGPLWLRAAKWQALEEIKQSKKAKSIGVSNFSVRQLKSMEKYAKQMPVVNQIEMHIFMQQPEMRKYCQKHDIQVEAYSPLAHGRKMDDPVIRQIAEKHKKTYSQIMLRWCVEQGAIPLPKSINPSRLAENISIFDFKLDKQDLDQLKRLNRNLRTLWSSILFG